MLATIGYEGSALNDFVSTLASSEVTMLIDIRERAQSRRKGFSKTALSETLALAGIRYAHLRALGDPKPGRDAARAGNLDEFKRIYRKVIGSKEGVGALERISSLMNSERVCLMCYERDFRDCHRAIVSQKLADIWGVPVRHLEVREIGVAQGNTRRVRDTRKGVAA